MEEDYLKGITIFKPQGARDQKNRPSFKPEGFTGAQAIPDASKPTIKQMQEENGGAGIFHLPPEEKFMLADPCWKYDSVPEIFNGRNIIDYVDPDIEERLAELEAEEDRLLGELAN